MSLTKFIIIFANYPSNEAIQMEQKNSINSFGAIFVKKMLKPNFIIVYIKWINSLYFYQILKYGKL